MSASAPSPNATSPTSLGSVVAVETVNEGTDDASGFHYETDDSIDESKGESLATSATGGTKRQGRHGMLKNLPGAENGVHGYQVQW